MFVIFLVYLEKKREFLFSRKKGNFMFFSFFGR